MILVGLTAILCTPFGLLRWRERRSKLYVAKYLMHRDMWIKLSTARPRTASDELINYHEQIMQKHASVTREPMLSVEADPPEPK